MQTEYIRSLNLNYERIKLDAKPDENKYQYCMLSRGGIKGILSCNLRYINGESYLYYDISSKQNIVQAFNKKLIDRNWMKDFIINIRNARITLERFLLDDGNIVWNPTHIYQDLEKNVFYYMYVPYSNYENEFLKLLDFFIEKINYEDERLVEFVYKAYESFEQNREVYLKEIIFDDIKLIDGDYVPGSSHTSADITLMQNRQQKDMGNEVIISEKIGKIEVSGNEVGNAVVTEVDTKSEEYSFGRKTGLKFLFDGRKKKQKAAKESYELRMQQSMKEYAVAEEPSYDVKDYGSTMFIDESELLPKKKYYLYNEDDSIIKEVDSDKISIGKMKDEVDVCFEDDSVSRIHAYILKENDDFYIEDNNSTNGTYKNNIRLMPYEKRKISCNDEIRIGRIKIFFK